MRRVPGPAGALAQLELRSVFRPGVLMAGLDNPRLVGRSGARDYTETYVGTVGGDPAEVFWDLATLL